MSSSSQLVLLLRSEKNSFMIRLNLPQYAEWFCNHKTPLGLKPEYFNPRSGPSRDLSELEYACLYFRAELESSHETGFCSCLYLWRSSEEKVTVHLHLVDLADQDGVHIVLVAQL